MATYQYQVITAAGKEKKGTLEAKSRDAAMSMLKNDKNIVVKCEESTGSNALGILHKAKKSIIQRFGSFLPPVFINK